jgi:DNA replication protein DnaC
VILIGGTGTGKSHIAIAIARSCIRAGRKARFFNVVDLVNKLEAEIKAGRQGRIADGLTRVHLVILDELGHLPFAQTGGQLLFHLQALRAYLDHRHHQPGLRGMALGVCRSQDDDRPARSPHAPLRHYRDRQ